MSDIIKFYKYHGLKYSLIDRLLNEFPNGINGKSWDIKELSRNPNLSWDYVEKHLEEINRQSWAMFYISFNENLPWDYVEKHPEGINGKSWNMKWLSGNPNLSWDYVEKHPEGINGESWYMKGLSGNRNLPWDFVEKHHKGINGKSWNIKRLSRNIGYDITKFYELPFAQKSFKDELLSAINELKYRPGGQGYIESQNHFNDLK